MIKEEFLIKVAFSDGMEKEGVIKFLGLPLGKGAVGYLKNKAKGLLNLAKKNQYVGSTISTLENALDKTKTAVNKHGIIGASSLLNFEPHKKFNPTPWLIGGAAGGAGISSILNNNSTRPNDGGYGVY